MKSNDQREKQAKCKFHSACNISRILQAVSLTEMMAHVLFSKKQKLLAVFQRNHMVENLDITTESDVLAEFYSRKNKEAKQSHLR